MISRQEFEKPYFFLLESLAGGRYSIAGWDPSEVVILQDGMTDDPFKILRDRLKSSRPVENPEFPFTGGWIGYLAYEAHSFLHDRVAPRPLTLVPKGVFGWYDQFYVYDHLEKKGVLVGNSQGNGAVMGHGEPGGRGHLPEPLDIGRSPRFARDDKETPPYFTSNFTKPQYLDAIRRIKNYLLEGDCYQVNLSQKFSCRTPLSAYQLYQKLREKNPAPYSAFLNLGDTQILSSSPECFLEVNGRDVITRPIKGTRRRGATPEEDGKLRQELSTSAKDQAELLMITDLERNDLGKVCEPGSISVPILREIQSFQNVHHTVATVQGRLRKDMDTIDLLKSVFPGGSITGAPKIRAMQIIQELEKDPREVYCGAIGYLSSNGRATFNIAIRTLILKEGEAHFWAGGGIVADSDPEAEYEETLIKAKGMVSALTSDLSKDF